MAKMELRGRLTGQQKTRLQNLFNMMYKPSELAEEIGISKRQFYRVYIPLGLPVERDSRNHVWINGMVFKDWIQEYYKKVKLKKTEAFCLTNSASVCDHRDRKASLLASRGGVYPIGANHFFAFDLARVYRSVCRTTRSTENGSASSSICQQAGNRPPGRKGPSASPRAPSPIRNCC